MRVADDSLRIDEKNRARVDTAFFIEYAVSLADRAVRPVIGEQRKRHAAELFRPRLQAGNSVRAELQDFNTELLEFFVVLTEPFDLVRSPACKCEWHERHHRALAAETAQRNGLAVMRCHRKIRRLGT